MAGANKPPELQFFTRTLSKITKASDAGLAMEVKMSMKPSMILPLVKAEVLLRWAMMVPSSFHVRRPLVWLISPATQFLPGAPGVSNREAGKSVGKMPPALSAEAMPLVGTFQVV